MTQSEGSFVNSSSKISSSSFNWEFLRLLEMLFDEKNVELDLSTNLYRGILEKAWPHGNSPDFPGFP